MPLSWACAEGGAAGTVADLPRPAVTLVERLGAAATIAAKAAATVVAEPGVEGTAAEPVDENDDDAFGG